VCTKWLEYQTTVFLKIVGVQTISIALLHAMFLVKNTTSTLLWQQSSQSGVLHYDNSVGPVFP